MNFISNIKTAFNAEHQFDNSAGFVDEILMIAGFALAALAVVNWIGGAAIEKGGEVADCIEGVNWSTGNTVSGDDCSPANRP